MPWPIEVTYTTKGKSLKKEREVIGVICPSALCLIMGSYPPPIFVSMGDACVDWEASSAALQTLLEMSSNDQAKGRE